jgi:hypothetical protein
VQIDPADGAWDHLQLVHLTFGRSTRLRSHIDFILHVFLQSRLVCPPKGGSGPAGAILTPGVSMKTSCFARPKALFSAGAPLQGQVPELYRRDS